MQTIIIVLGIEQGWAGIPVPENFERIFHFHSLSQKMGMQFYHFLLLKSHDFQISVYTSESAFQQWPVSSHRLFTFYNLNLNQLPLTSVANFPCDPLPDCWDKTQGRPCPNASRPEQELDGNVMPLSAWLAAVTKHENWICFSLVADTNNEHSVLFQALLVLMLFPISRSIND